MPATLRALLSSIVVLCLAAGTAPGQEEPAFLRECAAQLDGFASKCLKSGYPRRAKQVWQEVLRDYDTDDEAARQALGYVRVGRTWAPDQKFEFPLEGRPDPAVAKVLGRQWDQLAGELADGHLALAQELQAAGMAERASHHFERVLRFRADDAAAIAATGRKKVDGFTGSAVELAILQNSRAIDSTVKEQLEKTYDVTPVGSGQTNSYLAKIDVPVRGFETKHFVVWGNWPDPVLIECAQYAERALAFCEAILSDHEGFAWRHKDRFQFAFYQQREQWQQLLQANENEFDGSRLSFILNNTSATSIGSGPDRIRAVGFENQPSVADISIRQVVQSFCGMQSDALVEGVGHAVVGWFLGRNLVFSVAQRRGEGRTTTGVDEARFNMPDLEIWKELAVTMAWQGSDTPSARLPLVSAADFSSEDRIKAWGICDYLFRRDPLLLRRLDRTKHNASNANQVRDLFAEATDGMQLDDLDDAWRRFWTEDTPILQAVLGKGDPLAAISKDAPKVLEAFNEMRELLGQQPVVWSAEYSVACKQHADYLKADKGARGPVDEHSQEAGEHGGTGAGRTFASSALVATKYRKIDELVESWLQWPGYRDALLDPSLTAIGVFAERGIAVLDVTRGRGAVTTLLRFPSGVAPGGGLPNTAGPSLLVPTDVAVAELGPEVEEALLAAGVKRPRKVGYPISVHFFSPSAMPASESLKCVVKKGDREVVEGVIVIADSGPSRRSAASGHVVFYPLEPLKRGAPYTVEWSYRKAGQQRTLDKYQFFTK